MPSDPEIHTFTVSLVRTVPIVPCITKCPETNIINDNSMPKAIADPLEHFQLAETLVFHAFLVEKWVSHEVIFITSSVRMLISIYCR